MTENRSLVEADSNQWLPSHERGIRAVVSWLDVRGEVLLASGGTDGTIQVWDPETGSVVGHPIRAHAGSVNTLASWSQPRGAFVVSGGTDAAIRVWDPIAGSLVDEFATGNSSSAMSVVCWTDAHGRDLIVAGTYDAEIYIKDSVTSLNDSRVAVL